MSYISELPPELEKELADTFRQRDNALRWLNEPIPLFGGATPLSLIRDGRVDEVVGALRALNLGLFT